MNHIVSAQNNAGISVHSGDTIEVKLEETPTAGYNWELDVIENNIAALLASNYQVNAGAAIGGSGVRTITFVAKAPGAGTIRLKNMQRWSGDVDKVFELGVRVENQVDTRM